MMRKGWDVFFEPLNSNEEVGDRQKSCRICGEVIYGKEYNGPTSWAGSMAGIRTRAVQYKCPHADDDWHRQTLALRLLIEKTPSPSLAEMFKKDLEQIKLSRKMTKDFVE